MAKNRLEVRVLVISMPTMIAQIWQTHPVKSTNKKVVLQEMLGNFIVDRLQNTGVKYEHIFSDG